MIGKTCVMFGGTGFIGVHFSEFLLQNKLIENVVLADIKPLEPHRITPFIKEALDKGSIRFIQSDVRDPIKLGDAVESVDLIVNLAAVHREPGHEPHEYYDTNINGANHVCAYAEQVNCDKIIFTSSIAPYGPTETSKNEKSLPVPMSPYGGSKLVAEKIHVAWQNRDEPNRRLVIVRPGVVFGAGEGGNVSRLIKAVLRRYFFYMGNRDTRKAGVYVKELCNAMAWVLDNQDKHGEKISLFNMTMTPAPSVEDYVKTVCDVAGVERTVPSVPYVLLLLISYLVEPLAQLLRINQPISPVRIRKLVRSNNIEAKYLLDKGYQYQYDLGQAFRDWKSTCPQEW